MTSAEMRRDYSKVYNKMTIGELHKITPNVIYFPLNFTFNDFNNDLFILDRLTGSDYWVAWLKKI